jgi:uncharacterized membrane-anchored protein YhcB (DUF1043 family)
MSTMTIFILASILLLMGVAIGYIVGGTTNES